MAAKSAPCHRGKVLPIRGHRNGIPFFIPRDRVIRLLKEIPRITERISQNGFLSRRRNCWNSIDLTPEFTHPHLGVQLYS